MTGILVALLVIVTAALCFILGMIYGVALKAKSDLSQKVNSELFEALQRNNAWDWKEKK